MTIYEYEDKFLAKVHYLFYLTKLLAQNITKFIEYHLPIRNNGDFGNKNQTKAICYLTLYHYY